ncbi:MAG: hypothetical protein U9R26_01365 [Campylobacterota bacterium]|nr:hypothetical protein [Campylobacterota bacterium]
MQEWECGIRGSMQIWQFSGKLIHLRSLKFENGNKWFFQLNNHNSSTLERLIKVLNLPSKDITKSKCIRYPYSHLSQQGAYTFFDYAEDYLDLFKWLSEQTPKTSICIDDHEYEDMYDLRLQLMRISQSIVIRNELCGGLLLHGIMLKYNNKAIILAGESGRGKTTAAARVPSTSWEKISDDLTLVVRDKKGQYFAHPWPGTKAYTYFDISYESTKGTPIGGVFYLMQDKEVLIKPLKTLEAFAFTQEAADQAMSLPDPSIDPKRVGEVRKNRLSNITQFISKIHCHVLHLDKTKPFWKEIEALI